MKTKTKTKSKKKNVRMTTILSLCLAVVLLFEGWLMGSAGNSDWSNSFSVLDLSSDFQSVGSDLGALFDPLMVQIKNIETFYQLSATEMINLLRNDWQEDFMIFPNGVYAFYMEASDQLALLLDFSGSQAWPSRVAGVSITK